MAKTKEELNALKEEFKILNKKLGELTEEELGQVMGGNALSTLSRIPLGQFVQVVPTSLGHAAGIGKSYAAQTAKTEEVFKTIASTQAEAK